METIDYYKSMVVNPFTEDNTDDQVELEASGISQYRLDSISQMIGAKEASVNIRLFWDTIIEELKFDDDRWLSFAKACWDRIITVYELDGIDQFSENIDYLLSRKDLKEVLEFLECGKWVHPISKCIQSDNPEELLHVNMGEYVALRFQTFLKLLKDNKQDFPKILYYFLFTASSDEVSLLINKLVKKDQSALVTELILKNRGV